MMLLSVLDLASEVSACHDFGLLDEGSDTHVVVEFPWSLYIACFVGAGDPAGTSSVVLSE